MGTLRTLLRSHRWLALWLIAAALVVKALVPQGYMIVPGKTLTVAVCSGVAAGSMTIDVPMQPGKGEHPDKKAPDNVCPFAALSHAMVSGADLVLLLAAIAFLLSLGTAPAVLPPLRRIAHLRPPLRGPPAPA